MTETFIENVIIDGSSNVVQLTVQANDTQTEALQTWENSGGVEVARVQLDGRIQTGSLDTGAGATGDAQIEVFRHEDTTSLPKRGLNITGAIKDSLTSVVSWSVHELFLIGNAGVRALHSAMRVRVINQNTGTDNENGELKAGEFEVSNDGGSSGDPVPVAVGLDVRVTNKEAGHIGDAYGVRVSVSDLNSSGIVDAYAVHATGAKSRLDNVLELHGDLTSAPPAESDVAKIYVKSDGKLYARLGSGVEYLLSSAPAPQVGDETKFLRGDEAWADPLGGLLPLGIIVDWAGANDLSDASGEWLLCDGRPISRTTYADLFTIIGATYGTGDGSTTFNIPDLRGRVSIGPDNMGTSQGNAGRIAGNDALGNTSGSEKHTLIVQEMPAHAHVQNAHTHTISPNPHQHSIAVREPGSNFGSYFVAVQNNDTTNATRLTSSVDLAVQNQTATNQNTGGGEAHNNLQPYQVVNKIILVAQ